jgi:hypothetical protein
MRWRTDMNRARYLTVEEIDCYRKKAEEYDIKSFSSSSENRALGEWCLELKHAATCKRTDRQEVSNELP